MVVGLEFEGRLVNAPPPFPFKNYPTIFSSLSFVARNMSRMKLRQKNLRSNIWRQICSMPCHPTEWGELTLVNNLKGPIY